MDENDAIQTSQVSFTQRLDDVATDSYNEIRKCSFFDPIPSDQLRPIAELATIRTFVDRERLTSEGEEISAFFVMLFGRASVHVRDNEVATIHSGECIGESAFFAGEAASRSATVVAEGEVIAAEIKKSDIGKLNGESRAYMDKALLNALFRKLQQANRKIEDLLH
jgi:CRP-like cAMP-binding protein